MIVGVRGSELSDDIYRPRKVTSISKRRPVDQYCMEITGFEDTAKHPLTTALPENRPLNRNRGFFLKTEPKPTDLGQCETVTTLVIPHEIKQGLPYQTCDCYVPVVKYSGTCVMFYGHLTMDHLLPNLTGNC